MNDEREIKKDRESNGNTNSDIKSNYNENRI